MGKPFLELLLFGTFGIVLQLYALRTGSRHRYFALSGFVIAIGSAIGIVWIAK